MKRLKDIRDILFIAFVAIVGLIFIDSLAYKGLYSYLYLALAIVLLIAVITLSIIIYDTSESKELSLLEKLKNGGSFNYEVNEIKYDRERHKTFMKYMRILEGID